MDAIKERRLRSAKASIAFNDTRDKILHNKAELTKQVLKGEKTPVSNGILRVSQLYYVMYDEYYATKSIRMPTTPSKRSQALWSRVAKACEKSEVSPEDYMRAQFSFFHKAFGRPPELSQLATENAIERARAFVKAPPPVSKKVIGNDIRHTPNLADKLRAAEVQMQKLCRAQGMSREEVYQKLVIPGLVVFPPEYLKADPVYSQTKEKLSL